MLLEQLNLNQLRVFESVYRKRSMTAAAHELHLTQSGISQHIKSLEDMLGVRLFDRINQRLVPTPQSSELYSECAAALQAMEKALFRIKDGEKQLAGTLSIGMPIEFGNNMIVPLLSEFGRKHPLVKYKLRLGFASEMNDLLIKGDLDFAFIDRFNVDRRVSVERICDETLELCIAPARLEEIAGKLKPSNNKKKGSTGLDVFEKLDYVDYQEDQPLLRMWFDHHLESRNVRLQVRATVMDVQGVSRFILAGLGAGVIPGYLVSKLQAEGHQLHRFRGCGKALINEISVAYLRDRSHSPAARALMEFLKTELFKRIS